MRRFFALSGVIGGLGFGAWLGVMSPARAGDWIAAPVAVDESCAACIRDAIYADIKLISHLQANPDVDDSIKAPPMVAARADLYRLRLLLGPREQYAVAPCCYSRTPLHLR